MVAGDRLPDRIGIGVLAKVFPPELVDRVVDEAGVREQRKRTLPARVVVYLLLAMVLFFQSGYGEVWDKLVQGLEWARQFRVRVALGMQPSPAAVTQARQRLGWPVMQRLLEAVAGPLAGEELETACVAGMRLVAIDGMCLDVPATAGNGAEFGYPGNDAGPGPFPQVRVVGLGECGTRAVLGAELSPLATGEQPLARKLLPRLNRGDLLLADRNFLSHGLLKACAGRRRARAVAREKRHSPAGAGRPARRHVPVADRRSGCLEADAPQGRRPRGHPRHPGTGHRVLGDQRRRHRDLGDLHPGHRHHRSRGAVSGAGRGRLCAALAAGDLLR